MRSTTLKWIILITTITIGLLVAAQLYWLNKIYSYEQKEFRTSVVKSIQGVYEDLELTSSVVTQLQKLIEQPNSNSFLFKIDSLPTRDMLINDLLENLENFQVFADCKVGLYDAQKQEYLYQLYIPSAGSKQPQHDGVDMPLFKRNYTYVCLFFPHRNQYILNAMLWWIVSGGLLLLVLVALALSIFYLYRQKFLNEIQNDFIRNVTHEFQTPLTTLTVGLDAISKPFIASDTEKQKVYIKLMQAQTAYLKHHIENLMKVLKAEANGLSLQKNNTEPNGLISKAIDQLHALIEEKQAVVQFLPEKTNKPILADANSLYVAILNLVSNALKYSKKPLITIETQLLVSKYLISVKDNGIGIDEDSKKKLFRKFYRVSTGDVHDVKGLGLGLYFVKKVIDAHRGTITVKSALGKGSEFIIELPIQ